MVLACESGAVEGGGEGMRGCNNILQLVERESLSQTNINYYQCVCHRLVECFD